MIVPLKNTSVWLDGVSKGTTRNYHKVFRRIASLNCIAVTAYLDFPWITWEMTGAIFQSRSTDVGSSQLSPSVKARKLKPALS